MSEKEYLKLAIEEGKKGGPKHPFGAVVVKDGKILGRGFSQAALAMDPSAHAEIVALRWACKKERSNNIAGATLYASHEPCIMCFCCAAWADVDRIVFAHPASEMTGDMFEFEGVNIFEMAKKSLRKVKVEQISLENTI